MMIPLSISIFGLFSIHVYGCMIVLGLLTAYTLLMRDQKQAQLISSDQLQTVLTLSVFSGIIGGKLLYLLEFFHHDYVSWKTFLLFAETGFSVLGTFIAIIITSAIYLRWHHIPIFALFDRVFLYVPCMFSIARLGCFFAGCCYGMPTNSSFAVCYTHPDSLAPLGMYVHPTQLYSSVLELFLFIFLYFFMQYRFKKSGQLYAIYLIGMSFERFLIDFLRGDRTLIYAGLSFSQIVAVGVFMFGICIMILATANFFTVTKKEVSTTV